MPTDRLPGLGDVPAVCSGQLPKRIGVMLRRYGCTEEQQCGTCKHLVVNDNWYPYRWHKCDLYGVEQSASTDWRCRWPACGRWEG